MGRLIDVVRLFLFKRYVEFAAITSMIIMEYGLFDLSMDLNVVYQLINLSDEKEETFKTLGDLIKKVYQEYLKCLQMLPSGEELVAAFKQSKYYIN